MLKTITSTHFFARIGDLWCMETETKELSLFKCIDKNLSINRLNASCSDGITFFGKDAFLTHFCLLESSDSTFDS